MKIFIFGWYGQGNLGDEIFKISFRQLWSNFDLTFGNVIPSNINTAYDALWVGGGSFLDQPIKGIESVTIPIKFIGVGVCSNLPSSNRKAIERADLIVCRDSNSFGYIKEKAILASDLAFARNELKPLNLPQTKQITVILNDFLTPVGGAVPDWRSLSYYWFLQEFSKILDRFVSAEGYRIKLLPLCINPRFDDRRIAAAVQGRSSYPQKYDWVLEAITETTLRQEISKSAFVITQRFHGLVYSIIEHRPCIALCTHDKFNSLAKDFSIPSLDYYGVTDSKFEVVLKQVLGIKPDYGAYIDAAKKVWDSIALK